MTSRAVSQWPRLAWVVTFEQGTNEMLLFHGPMVEVSDQWAAEAVWDGEFTRGDFDTTDIVFGSGVRLRDNKVIFVSSGSTLDRIWYFKSDSWYVSNSLPAILAGAQLSLCDDFDYTHQFKSICKGLRHHGRSFPTNKGEVYVCYFNNLVYDGTRVTEVEKPDVAPHFASYHDYYEFMLNTAARLGDNIRCPARRHRVEQLSTISSGYDSPASAVIAAQAGCRHTVTFRQSTSIWRGSDSGEHMAGYLNMAVRTYSRIAKEYPNEEAVWAVTGRPGVLNWTLFDYPKPLCCLFTGCHGDKVWNRGHMDLDDIFQIPSIADLGIGEFRLFEGVFHCPVPFWGMRHLSEIRAISCTREMNSWTVGGQYDRPIARRILEEKGVPRTRFALRKKNTSSETYFLWPYSRDARVSFDRFLKERNLKCPPYFVVRLLRIIAHFNYLIESNVIRKFHNIKGLQNKLTLRGCSMLFHWANSELKKTYERALRVERLTLNKQPRVARGTGPR